MSMRNQQLLTTCTGDQDHDIMRDEGNTPLHIACLKGYSSLVESLVQNKGCDVNSQAKDGSTPLHTVCRTRNGRIDIVKILTNTSNCDPEIRDSQGNTPLHMACENGNTDIAMFLVQKKCDVNCRANDGSTPLHSALNNVRGTYYAIRYTIKVLLQNRCDTTLPDSQGRTPQTIPLNKDINGDLLLHIACHLGDVDIVRYLVCEQHCDMNAQNKNGDSPLHIASHNKSLDIIKFLLQQRCDTMVRNKRGQSPQTIPLNENGDILLQIACQWGDVDIVRYLVCEQHCDMNAQNKNGDSPLHTACYKKSSDIIKFLLQQKCNTRFQNKRGQSPQTIPLNENGDLLLHTACHLEDVDIVRFLVCEQHCDLNAQNKNGDSPLHVACQGMNLDIVKYLITEQHCDLNVRNKNGDSPLHAACKRTNPDIVKYLITEQHCDVSVRNSTGDSLLHAACYHKTFDIIKFLLQQKCDTMVRNKRGQSPQTIPLNENGDLLLHIACQWGDVDIVRYLVCEQHSDLNVRNKNGDSPLHVACQGTNPDIVKYLITEQHCDVNVRNKNGDSPLHVAIVSYQPSTALYLLQHKQCNPTLPDSDGNTALHLACMNCANVDGDSEMLQVARFLLSSTDLSACVNTTGQTPVELTTNYQLIQNISHITKCKTKHSIQTYIKMFFIGNPTTGKSTLVKAIYSEKSRWWKLLPRWFSRVKNVPCCTAGIIPITFRSKKFGNTVLYDMAGQYEYYTSHAAVIENTVLSSPPAFVVVVDLSESDDKIMERVKYWWSFIDNHTARSIVPPHVILIGSHADVIKARGVSVQEKMSTISSALRGLSSSFHFVGQVALDCRDPVSSVLGQFCYLVDQSCTALRQTVDIDLRCHVAYSFLLETFEDRVACTVSEIAAQITATDTLLPQNPDQLAHLMSSLSDKGLVLLVMASDSIEESWVILQKQEVLNEFNGTIFAPENFREHKDFARSTGVVPFSRIKQEFPRYDPAMIVGFLTHLEFCFKIDDPEALKRIEDEAPKHETSLDLSDEYYFFPALVSVDTPHQVWQPDDSMVYQCGWYYRCHPDQFLTSRFLHVLILRLAFSFALGLDKYHPSQSAPVLCRRCSVWKHGLGWLQDGIETVVEVGLQCQWVNVMMRCFKGKEVNCVQLRSAVIQEIKSARNDLCKAVNMTEFVIRPSNVHYPFSDELVSLYSLTDIANAIAKKETHVVDQQSHNSSKTLIPLCNLVLFEPYLCVGPELLNELFHQDNSDKLVSATFLAHLASRVHPQISFFEEVIDPQPAMHYQEELETKSLPASKCFILLQWLLRKLKDPMYENLHKELDKFSIFCGRNPLVSEYSGLPMNLQLSSIPCSLCRRCVML